MGVYYYRRILLWRILLWRILLWRILYPCVDVVSLEPPAFQEELIKCPTFHNFADPILHNIVVKNIFAWVYLVSTEQIANRGVWKLLELATTDRKWIEIDIPAILCSKLRQAMGRRKRNRKIFCAEGSSLYEILWETMNLPLSHWHVCSEKP